MSVCVSHVGRSEEVCFWSTVELEFGNLKTSRRCSISPLTQIFVWKVKQHIKPVHVCVHRRYIALITGYESAWVSTQMGGSRCSSGLQEPDALLALLNVSQSSSEGSNTSDLLFSRGRNRLMELVLMESRLSNSILNFLQQTSTC